MSRDSASESAPLRQCPLTRLPSQRTRSACPETLAQCPLPAGNVRLPCQRVSSPCENVPGLCQRVRSPAAMSAYPLTESADSLSLSRDFGAVSAPRWQCPLTLSTGKLTLRECPGTPSASPLPSARVPGLAQRVSSSAENKQTRAAGK